MRYQYQVLLGRTFLTLTALATTLFASAVPASAETYTPPAITERMVDGGLMKSGWISEEDLRRYPNSDAARLVAQIDASVGSPTSATASAQRSASTCDQSVCIDVRGTGLYVDTWGSTAKGTTSGCIKSYFNTGTYRLHTISVCGKNAAGVYYAVWDADRNFSQNQYLTSSWTVFQGRPTVQVHR